VEEDGLYRPTISSHSLEKLRRHNRYAELFSKAMHKKWPQRAYVGLYAGAGRAVVKETGALVETSALAVFRQEVPLTKYIFVDADTRCIHALEARIAALNRPFDVTLINREVNAAVGDIINAMPAYGAERGLISLCFVDPFRVDLDFDVIRRLSRFKMDFLVMLPLGYDLRRNLHLYLANQDDLRVATLIGAPDWRDEWRAERRPDRYLVRFVLRKFDEAMERLGFRQRELKDTVSVKVTGMGVYIYSLALYTRHELGEQF
jgi:three-Cys-motif partner protein